MNGLRADVAEASSLTWNSSVISNPFPFSIWVWGRKLRCRKASYLVAKKEAQESNGEGGLDTPSGSHETFGNDVHLAKR